MAVALHFICWYYFVAIARVRFIDLTIETPTACSCGDHARLRINGNGCNTFKMSSLKVLALVALKVVRNQLACWVPCHQTLRDRVNIKVVPLAAILDIRFCCTPRELNIKQGMAQVAYVVSCYAIALAAADHQQIVDCAHARDSS